jgi:endonuclease/exonuclease/phosphatase family metal-dependent hydrolase
MGDRTLVSFGIAFITAISTIAASAASVTVGTQNLFHWMHSFNERTAALKREVDAPGFPDIMGLQEAARWAGGKSIYDVFLDFTQYSAKYKITNKMGIMTDGVALASRWRGRDCKNLELPGTSINSRQWLNVCSYIIDNKTISVINVHLSPSPWKSDSRLQQVKFVLEEVVQKSKYPTLIVGDLNDTYSSAALLHLRSVGFQDVLDGQGSTYVSKENPYVMYPGQDVRLDYILFRPTEFSLREANFMFRENLVSDHFGLKAQFETLN